MAKKVHWFLLSLHKLQVIVSMRIATQIKFSECCLFVTESLTNALQKAKMLHNSVTVHILSLLKRCLYKLLLNGKEAAYALVSNSFDTVTDASIFGAINLSSLHCILINLTLCSSTTFKYPLGI